MFELVITDLILKFILALNLFQRQIHILFGLAQFVSLQDKMGTLMCTNE